MNEEQARQFGAYVKNHRLRMKMSGRELARAAGIDTATLVRLEQGRYRVPRPETLKGIARALELPLADVFTLAEYVSAYDLPTLAPYLRAKYSDLPGDAVKAVNDYFERIAAEYGLDVTGPGLGEDETPITRPEDIPPEDLLG